MNLFFWAAIIVMLIGLMVSVVDRAYGWEFPTGWTVVAVILAVIGFFVYMGNTPEAIAQRSADAEARKAALTPHVVREFDGCKIYRWRNSDSDNWHYVTKCPTEVTTESNRSVPRRQGKTTVYDIVPEIINTER